MYTFKAGWSRMHPYIGNIHIHSTYSDGHKSIEKIALAAKSAGLAFIVITDHHTLQGLPQEGYIHNVLVLIGSEINTQKNHYLALNITEPIEPNDSDPQQVIDNVNAQGGFGIIAHPFEIGSPLVLDNAHYPWTHWDAQGYTGIEVWNWCSQWRDGVRNILQGLYYAYINPTGPITGPTPQAMAHFDEVAQHRPITAIAGSDAHAWPIRKGPIRRTIFPYRYLFRTANNYLLLDEPLSKDPAKAKIQIYNALRHGRSYIVNNLIGTAQGFSFTAINQDQQYQIGDTVPLKDITGMQIKCPHQFRGRLTLRVIRNGQLLDEIPRCNVTLRLYDPGVYRLEVYCNKKPWIFTNPIYIT